MRSFFAFRLSSCMHSVCLYACVCLPFVCLPDCLSAVWLSACLPVCLSACLFVCLSACLHVCLFTFFICISFSIKTGVPGLRKLVKAFVDAIPMLSNTIGLLCFFYVLFGLIGMQMFMGAFNSVCMDLDTGMVPDYYDVCGSRYQCKETQLCISIYEPPALGLCGFDNVGMAFLTIFEICTLSSWSRVMYWTMDAIDWYTCFYFVFLIIFCVFFVINLTLAVIQTQVRIRLYCASAHFTHISTCVVLSNFPCINTPHSFFHAGFTGCR
jgi:hypothetical protein